MGLNDKLTLQDRLDLQNLYDEFGFHYKSDSDFVWKYTSKFSEGEGESEAKKLSSYVTHLECRLKELTLEKARALDKGSKLLDKNLRLLDKCGKQRTKILSQEKHIDSLEKQIRYLRRQVRVKDQELAEMDEKLSRGIQEYGLKLYENCPQDPYSDMEEEDYDE